MAIQVLFFYVEAFRMNEQPVSQIPFKGDWGCFSNKQICEDCIGEENEKMSEPVQVYTACQFVRLQKTLSPAQFRPNMPLHSKNTKITLNLKIKM